MPCDVSTPGSSCWARTARRAFYVWPALLALVTAGCVPDEIFGPDTATARSRVQGTVVSSVDQSPIQGVRVYPRNTGWAISSNGRAPTIDTVTTDASGRYVLESEHFCPSALVFRAEGYNWDSSFQLGCPSPDGTIVDAALTPLSPG